jgi:hypothetical protein
MATPLRRADVCNNAVKKPVGYVNPDSQNTFGISDATHVRIWSQRSIKSRIQDPNGFWEG